jgi:hypothetical protein
MGDDERLSSMDGSIIAVQCVAHLCCRLQQRRYDVNFPRKAVAINQWRARRVCAYILYHIFLLRYASDTHTNAIYSSRL